MIEQRVYTPTNYIEKTVVHSVIFLAGPIQGAVDWQSTAIELIKKENPHIIIGLNVLLSPIIYICYLIALQKG